jgi:hypothetical protein
MSQENVERIDPLTAAG